MNLNQAFNALERLVVVAAQEHFSVELIQNASDGLQTLRALHAQAEADALELAKTNYLLGHRGWCFSERVTSGACNCNYAIAKKYLDGANRARGEP